VKGKITMKLYGSGNTPNPRKVKIVLAEKAIAYEMVEMDLQKGEHKTPEFIQINPLGRVPVLETDDGVFLTEAIAICRYLEALHPGPNLFGGTADDVGIIEMHHSQIESDFWYQVRSSWKHSPVLKKMGYQVAPDAKVISDANVYSYYEKLNKDLSNKEYLAVSRFTIADIILLVCLDFAIHYCGLIPDESLKNLWRWHGFITSRESVEEIS
jgi:glutathione S-transferase